MFKIVVHQFFFSLHIFENTICLSCSQRLSFFSAEPLWLLKVEINSGSTIRRVILLAIIRQSEFAIHNFLRFCVIFILWLLSGINDTNGMHNIMSKENWDSSGLCVVLCSYNTNIEQLCSICDAYMNVLECLSFGVSK